ncbi:UDP-4-amino-4,6-dideoxy-N-acetyl-beta-L-altrosamine N-acetyltransferase [Evansella halocellulosilytica]|uniref:UDP-4-amino-4, 6-dideoxy-N-acetyl-beta-L-altrosamine N-acetyltransferase n=1 Tax=Evansella halocellulosilytica TaxID=2011013 RepID=UPI000BB8FF91|nr:UDP-4-amino-4,6-dideoxy-N-acetyl-beta-L-altrosamine N-acetyltransferase [Evansella halocellulosilytica]
MLKIDEYQLRDMTYDDIELVLTWRNSVRVMAYMYTDHHITKSEHEEWFTKVSNDESTVVKLFLYREKPIGLVKFSHIDKRHNRCYWGFYLGESNLPRGTGKVLGLLSLHFLFNSLNIRKLCAEVLSFNQKSINYHKMLGFKEEGRFLKHVKKNGKYVDVFSFALFSHEWPEVKKRLQKKVEGEDE